MGSKSKSSSSTTSNFYDNRSVIDAGGGVVGNGNALDNSTHSTSNVDLSDRSVTNVTTVDPGAIALAQKVQEGAASFNTLAASKAFDLASSSNAQTAKSSSDALGFAKETFDKVLGLAGTVVGQAGAQSKQASEVAAGAYQSAADTSTGNKTLIYAGMAVIGLAAVAFIFKR